MIQKKFWWKVSESFQKRNENRKRKHGCKQYKNLSQIEKQKPVDYRKKNIMKCEKIKRLMFSNITKKRLKGGLTFSVCIKICIFFLVSIKSFSKTKSYKNFR